MAHRHADGPAVAGQALHQIAADESGAAEDRHDAAHTRPSRPLSTSRPPRQAPGRRIYTKPGMKLTASIDCLFWVAGADSDASPSIRATRPPRSEERRVGKECVSTCRYRWSPYHLKKTI